MRPVDGGEGLQGQRAGLDGDGRGGPVEQRQHLLGDLLAGDPLLLEEIEHPHPRHPAPVHLPQHRREVGHQPPDVPRIPRREAVQVAGHQELGRGGGVLGEPQHQLGPVLLPEILPQQLAPEGLHVGAHAVLDGDQHVQDKILRREPLPEEPEGPGAGVVPPGIEHPQRPRHVPLHAVHAPPHQLPRDLAHREGLVVAEPRQLVHRERPRQIPLQHQQRPQLLRLPVARPQQPADPLRIRRHQRVVQILQDHPLDRLAHPLRQLVPQQRVRQQLVELRREQRARTDQPPHQLPPGPSQILLRVRQQPRDQQRPLEQLPVR